MIGSRIVLPIEIISSIASELGSLNALGTLAKVALATQELYSIAIPVLYSTLKVREDRDYSILLDTLSHHLDTPTDPRQLMVLRQRPAPTKYIKHLTIAHFPSFAICHRIHILHTSLRSLTTVASTLPFFLLPSVETIEFTLSSCHSILWGPMQRLRFPTPTLGPLTPGEIIRSLSLLASPSSLCVHLSHYSVLDRDWNRFFSLLSVPWKDTLKVVNIHGLEHWLKAFLPGIKHVLFLDIDNVPYRPGTGLLMARTNGAEREKCLEVWAEVLLAMTTQAMDREQAAMVRGDQMGMTLWEVHCPGARGDEIFEAEKLLMEKLKVSIAKEMWERLQRSSEPFIRFITSDKVACAVCKGKQAQTVKLIKLECAPVTIPRTLTP